MLSGEVPHLAGSPAPCKAMCHRDSPSRSDLRLATCTVLPSRWVGGGSSHEGLSYFRVSAEAPSSETCLSCLEASPLLHLISQEGVLASSGESRPFRCPSPARGGEQISSNPAPVSMHSEILQMLFALQCMLKGPAALQAEGGTCPKRGLTSVTQPHLPASMFCGSSPRPCRWQGVCVCVLKAGAMSICSSLISSHTLHTLTHAQTCMHTCPYKAGPLS